jgi:glycosyltransferase involved in cell wall biosynthesis
VRIPCPDVVLIESQPVFTSLAGMFISRMLRVPYVLNVSDFWPEYLLAVGAVKEDSLIYRTFFKLVNMTFRRAAQIITLYPPLSENVESRIGQAEKIHTIYNAVDLDQFCPGLDTAAFRQQHDLGDAKLVTFIGTFGTHIDFETMMDVATHFNQRQDVRFVFIGTGGQRERVTERLAQGDLSNSRWIGWIDHADMPLAWNASYIAFWAIHNHELYRNILQSKTYEAMASGTPMAIAVEGITTDIIARSQSGLTVPFKDQQGLIAAIERLLDNPNLRNELSQSARAYAEQHFDPNKVAAAYESVLMKSVKAWPRFSTTHR